MKKVFVYTLMLLVLFSCIQRPQIPISDTLEIALDLKYDEYVDLLNKSFNGDSEMLLEFLKIDGIHGAASYDHGYILTQLLYKLGDNHISSAVLKLDDKEKANLKMYFLAGIDANSSAENFKIINDYSKTFSLIGIEK